jgi:hypothetical protein
VLRQLLQDRLQRARGAVHKPDRQRLGGPFGRRPDLCGSRAGAAAALRPLSRDRGVGAVAVVVLMSYLLDGGS